MRATRDRLIPLDLISVLHKTRITQKVQDRDEIGRNIYLAALARRGSLSTRGHYREKLDFDESEEQSGVEEETRKE